MVVDETMLRAYVDGELEPAARDQVEAVVAHNPDMQALVAALRASCLPYRAAFEAQALPPVPAALQQQAAALLAVARAVAPARQAPARRQWLGASAALAASFAAGAFVPAQWWRRGEPAAWVQAITTYHSLYVRETVDQAPDAPAKLRSLLAGFSAPQQAALFVPDLAAAGLSFKRVQRLGWGSLPLIQMVFLPASGKPAALCALPLNRGDSAVEARRIDGLGVASWHHLGVAYVLVADMPASSVGQLAQQLAEGKFRPA